MSSVLRMLNALGGESPWTLKVHFRRQLGFWGRDHALILSPLLPVPCRLPSPGKALAMQWG